MQQRQETVGWIPAFAAFYIIYIMYRYGVFPANH